MGGGQVVSTYAHNMVMRSDRYERGLVPMWVGNSGSVQVWIDGGMGRGQTTLSTLVDKLGMVAQFGGDRPAILNVFDALNAYRGEWGPAEEEIKVKEEARVQTYYYAHPWKGHPIPELVNVASARTHGYFADHFIELLLREPEEIEAEIALFRLSREKAVWPWKYSIH